MRVDGRWRLFRDGILRPVVDGAVQTPGGAWRRTDFLVDSGADRTVFSARFLPVLRPLAVPATAGPVLAGVGGRVACIYVPTAIAFVRDDGVRVTVRGTFGVFVDPASSDVPVLGRDVTNNFDVLYSYGSRQVVLAAPPHRWQLQRMP
jgi:hypothetical protein